MTHERDSDRQLRAWAAEGVDRAPERVVWAALDEIERVPQRRAWRTWLDGLAVRLRPSASLLGAATVVVLAFVVLARLASPNVPSVGARDFAMADLPGILLWEDTKPRTWTLDNLVSNPHDVLEIPVRSMTGTELDDLPEPDGYLGGRYTDFSGPGGPDALFMSWGALFESAEDAAAALPFFQQEMQSAEAWGLGAGAPAGLGVDGLVYTGETTAFLGPPTGVDPVPAQVYLWRRGNLLLAVGGWWAYDPEELRTVAEGMDARAAAAEKIP